MEACTTSDMCARNDGIPAVVGQGRIGDADPDAHPSDVVILHHPPPACPGRRKNLGVGVAFARFPNSTMVPPAFIDFHPQLKSTTYSHRGSSFGTTPSVQHVSLDSPQETPGQHLSVREISLSASDPASTGVNTPPALAPAWDTGPDTLLDLASKTFACEPGIPTEDLGPGSARVMSIACVPDSQQRVSHDLQRTDSAGAAPRWQHVSPRYEPYPLVHQEQRPARRPGFIEQQQQDEDYKPQILQQPGHPQFAAAGGGYPNDLQLQLRENGSAPYASTSYMCNPPSRMEGRVNAWPSEHLRPPMTNVGVCHPLPYEVHGLSSSHDGLAGEGFDSTPLYYQHHHDSSQTNSYHQTLPSHGFPGNVADSSAIGIPQPASHVQTHLGPFNPEQLDVGGEEVTSFRQKRSPSSPITAPAIAAPYAHMDITRLDNPLPESHHHHGWGTTVNHDVVDHGVVDHGVVDHGVVDNGVVDGGLSGHKIERLDAGESSSPSNESPIVKRTQLPRSRPRKATSEKPKDKQPKKKGVRRPFTDLTKREETAETRRRRACTRCREQKMRCQVDPDNPDGDCQPCRDLNKESKKTIHRAPCQRGKITDAVLVRPGGLGLTKRWRNTEMKDVGNRCFPPDVRDIEFKVAFCDEPFRISVIKFDAIEGDALMRIWRDRGKLRWLLLAAYCLNDIGFTCKYFDAYVRRNAVPSLRKFAKTGGKEPDAGGNYPPTGHIEKTYEAALNYYDTLKRASSQTEPTPSDKRKETLLANLFLLWFSMRHTTGSAYIVGKETLGMEPYWNDDGYPLRGKVSLPRIIVAQFDSINHNLFLQRYSKEVLKDLEFFMNQKSEDSWWVIYLTLFILMHEASWITQDRYRHARQNYGSSIRYTLPDYVEELQSSCTLLMQSWHYYNTQVMPHPAKPWERHKSALATLTPEQYHVVMQSRGDETIQGQLNYRRTLKASNYTFRPPAPTPHPVEAVSDFERGPFGPVPPTSSERVVYGPPRPEPPPMAALDWDHPLFWVSQLFEEDWSPHPTYQREPVPRQDLSAMVM
ncbi:hypothetical protein HJFPF1_07623 [Paramyrothecium foliicola]|nr:hypothetical protein HJFPF1_07623 [Paramyrothecium foliicola]